ncbi:MAG TPA: hypothetical protein GXX20_09615 [Clostridiaceae bacterium]|nr:hypothetical protein [Clostridiaceae bacterium]
MLGSSKRLLSITVIALVLIGLSYTLSFQEGFVEAALTNATLIELVPDECKVINTSKNLEAGVSFIKDEFGNIVDKTYIMLSTKNVYAGASATFCITARNISDIPLSVDQFTLHVDSRKDSISDLMYFSGKVKIYRNDGVYYDELGTFSNINLAALADNLTSLTKYRKIDSGEKLVLELQQKFSVDSEKFVGKVGLSYRLEPVFVQYFPKEEELEEELLVGNNSRDENVS